MCQILVSQTLSSQVNLAFEEYLVSKATSKTDIFFLWQNDETVVIGRNQNPWKECNVPRIKSDNIHMVRRLTGGGAVFHDQGNLNFTFISKYRDDVIDDNFKVIIEALKQLNIDSSFNGRNDLLVKERKVSGNAFVLNGNIQCHHGTLLIDADLERLKDYLTVSKLKLEAKGIESVRSRVENLKTFNENLTVDLIVNTLIDTFKADRKTEMNAVYLDESEMKEEIKDFKNRYMDWSWNYGSTPKFDVQFNGRFDWGEWEINLNVKNSKIVKATVYTDSNDVRVSEMIQESLKEIHFEKDQIIERLKGIGRIETDDIARDILDRMF